MQMNGEYNQYISCPNTSKCEQASMHKKNIYSFKSFDTFLTSHVNDLLMFTSIKHHIICCIPDIVENCRTLKLLIHPQKLWETMNVVGGVCVEHNLPSLLSSSLKDRKVFVSHPTQ
jgi:hypothetical protein